MNNLHKAGALLVAGALLIIGIKAGSPTQPESLAAQDSILLPIVWGDTGARLVEAGVIDPLKLAALYEASGLPPEYRALLEAGAPRELLMTAGNASYLLTLLWAFGLANENPILFDPAEMMNPAYANERAPGSGFASTGGWTLAQGGAMEHYGKHRLAVLTDEQQELVDRVSRNVYRPCCSNSTHFPDCNHGMAMLALLELAAAAGAGEETLYETARAVNSYWFPDTPGGSGCAV